MSFSLVGTMRPEAIVTGVPRGRFGLYQRRVRARVFGEPRFDVELVPPDVHPARPHVIAFAAWRALADAAVADGVDPADVAIHSAYRSVALQAEVWAYRLDERRRRRQDEGLPPLPERELARLQMKWTAKPGQSAHHTGFALDLGLYRLGKRGSKEATAYAWLAENARHFGFYPYLPEGWHWEYNPPGLVRQVARLRTGLGRGLDPGLIAGLMRPPARIPIARPGRGRGARPAAL